MMEVGKGRSFRRKRDCKGKVVVASERSRYPKRT